MEILSNSNEYLISVLPEIIEEKLNEKVCNCKFIGGGSFGKVFKVELSDGRIIALKSYRIKGDQNTEAFQLNYLSKNTSVKMPSVLFTYENDKTAIMAMTFVKGKNALEPEFLLKSRKQKKEFAETVVSGMLKWHSVTGEKFGDLQNPVYDSWFEFYKNEKQEPWLKALGELTAKGKFSKKKLELLSVATRIFNNLPQKSEKPVLIHGDLNIMNIMADPKTMKLEAFIDPCGSLWAEREYDLFQLRNMWGDAFGLYETYKAGYNLSEYADFRVAYYASMHEASMRLSGGLIVPLWENLNNKRLKKEMKKISVLP